MEHSSGSGGVDGGQGATTAKKERASVPNPGLNGNVPPPFLSKTYDMVDDPATDAIVSWGPENNSFVVWNPPEFARDLLPKLGPQCDPQFCKGQRNWETTFLRLEFHAGGAGDEGGLDLSQETFLCSGICQGEVSSLHGLPRGCSDICPVGATFLFTYFPLKVSETTIPFGLLRLAKQLQCAELIAHFNRLRTYPFHVEDKVLMLHSAEFRSRLEMATNTLSSVYKPCISTESIELAIPHTSGSFA
ncbi:hypothetical protein BHE74_00042163 [Ensete ventricosum]|nr:hypothetical protein BHE74_00042163 [Ensete ventricosum]